jgi:hypothetical protein
MSGTVPGSTHPMNTVMTNTQFLSSTALQTSILYSINSMYNVITVTFPMFTGMKSFAAHIHNIFYVSVEFSHSYHFETNQSVSMKEIAAKMVTEIRDRTDEFLAVYDWMSFVFSFFFLMVLFK